jgi:uncharacterized protein YdaU (DUF1376 family)
MNFYRFHVGDYIKHTSHLSAMEDLAYRRLLDYYYDSELPLPKDLRALARRIRIDYEVVASIVVEFFRDTDEGWSSKRCDEEIKQYQGFVTAGKHGAAKRWAKGGDSPPNSPPITPPNQGPMLTNNHKPITNNQKKTVIPAPPSGVAPEVWQDWLKIRKAKRLPWTDTAWQEIQIQIADAGLSIPEAIRECCARGWGSFRADWHAKHNGHQPTETNYQRTMREKFESATGRTRPQSGGLIDVTPITLG